MPVSSDAAGIISGYGRHIQFGQYDWRAKVSSVPVGPGPNLFSDSPDTVWTDDMGRLHLKIAQDSTGFWQSAEVVLQASLGYGTYRFYLERFPRLLDPNVVLGLFTWNDDPYQNHRELDIELARWGQTAASDGRYTVQPVKFADHTFSFDGGQPDTSTTESLEWQPARAYFASWRGWDPAASDDTLIATHVFTSGIPEPRGAQVRMNLWLDAGAPPTDRRPVEIIVAGFDFSPGPLAETLALNPLNDNRDRAAF